MTEEESNHYFEVAKEIIDKYFEEKKLLKQCRQTGRTNATTEKVLKTVFSQMTDKKTLECEIEENTTMTKKHPNENTTYITTASGHPIDADDVIINGVKYKKVEKPKPKTLYDVIYKWQSYDSTCDKLVDMIEEWLPDELEYEDGDYAEGWNNTLRTIKNKLR